jgi:hypothetical protein
LTFEGLEAEAREPDRRARGARCYSASFLSTTTPAEQVKARQVAQ